MLDRFLSHPPLVIAGAIAILLLVAGWRYVDWRREAAFRIHGRNRRHEDG
jgi:hypothetical protein